MSTFKMVIIIPIDFRAKRVYNIKQWTIMEEGGHFPAVETPGLLADDIKIFFSSLEFKYKKE